MRLSGEAADIAVFREVGAVVFERADNVVSLEAVRERVSPKGVDAEGVERSLNYLELQGFLTFHRQCGGGGYVQLTAPGFDEYMGTCIPNFLTIQHEVGRVILDRDGRTSAVEIAQTLEQPPYRVNRIVGSWAARGLITGTEVMPVGWSISRCSEALRRLIEG